MNQQQLTREEGLAILTQWAPQLRGVRFYTSTPPRLVLVVEGVNGIQQIDLGSRPPSQMHVRWAILAATGKLPPPVANGAWESVLMAMAAAMEVVEAPETDEWGALADLVGRYIEARRPVGESDRVAFATAHRYDEPIVYKGEVCVSATALAIWARGRGLNYTPRELALLLRRYGAEPRFIHVWDSSSGSSRGRRYWAIPASMLPEHLRDIDGGGAASEKPLDASNPLHIYTSQEDPLREEKPDGDEENRGASTHLHMPQEGGHSGGDETSVDALRNGEKSDEEGKNFIYTSSRRSVDALRGGGDPEEDPGWEVI